MHAISIEMGHVQGNSDNTSHVVHEKYVIFDDFEQTRGDVSLLSAKGSVTTWELTTSFDETEHDIRNAEDVSFELTIKSEGSGALLTYGLAASGLVSSDRGTSGEVVNVSSDSSPFSRVTSHDRYGGFSLNGSESSKLTAVVSPEVPESKRLLVDYSLSNADGNRSEQTSVEFVDLYINVVPEDPR